MRYCKGCASCRTPCGKRNGREGKRMEIPEGLRLVENVSVLTCPSCGDRIWSKHRHDFLYCRCGVSFIDGGRDYTRYGCSMVVGEPIIKVEDILFSIETGEWQLLDTGKEDE